MRLPSYLQHVSPAAIPFLLLAVSSDALERSSRVAPELPSWSAGATCSIAYYNACNGWLWSWGGFTHGDRFGVVYSACGNPCTLDSSRIFFFEGDVGGGRGFTGTLEVYAVDENDFPAGAPLYAHPMLPVVCASDVKADTWGRQKGLFR